MDDPDDPGFGFICSPADLCSRLSDCAVHLHVVLIALILTTALYPFSNFSDEVDSYKLLWRISTDSIDTRRIFEWGGPCRSGEERAARSN